MELYHKVMFGVVALTVVTAVGTVEYVNWQIPSNSHESSVSNVASATTVSGEQSTSNTSSSPSTNHVVTKSVSRTSTGSSKVLAAVSQVISDGSAHSLDSSAFVQNTYAAAGVKVPRTFAEQAKAGTIVQHKNDLKAGDIVFFGLNTGLFDGIYLGNNQFVALTTHGVIKTSLSDPYWGPRFLYGRRVL